VKLSWLSTLRVFLAHGSRDFFRHKTLSLLNLLALAVGVGAIVAIQTVNETALRSFRASLDLVAGRCTAGPSGPSCAVGSMQSLSRFGCDGGEGGGARESDRERRTRQREAERGRERQRR
jgi:hypothetical protein